jgi:hypothetical protein
MNKRFKQLLEAELGNVKPLIGEDLEEMSPNEITIKIHHSHPFENFVSTENQNTNFTYHSHGIGEGNWKKLYNDGLKLKNGKYYPILCDVYDVKKFKESKLKEGANWVYLIYSKDNNEINVVQSDEHISSSITNQEGPDFFNSLNVKRNIFAHFTNGVKVGEVDDRGWFKIVEA